MAALEEAIKNQQAKSQRPKLQGETAKLEAEGEVNPVHRTGDSSSQDSSSQPLAPSVFRRDGDYWTITHGDISFRLKHIRGLDYIAQLLKKPNSEFHVLDLIPHAQWSPASRTAADNIARGESPLQTRPTAADALLDSQAREAYKHRLAELREELEEAQAFNDLGRADKAQQEIDFLSAELSRGFGLGGRERNAPSSAERARVNVTKGIKAALAKIAEHSPHLEHYLASTIKTGVFCSYTPPPFNPISWEL
jgi:hypothetical protein